VALCLLGLGDTDDALKHFDQAIELAKRAGMRQDQAYWLRQKGNGLIHQGKYDQGLTAHTPPSRSTKRSARIPNSPRRCTTRGASTCCSGTRTRLKNTSPGRWISPARPASPVESLRNLIALGDLHFRRKAFDAATELYHKLSNDPRNPARSNCRPRACCASRKRIGKKSAWRLRRRQSLRHSPFPAPSGPARSRPRRCWRFGDLQRRRGQLPEALQSFARPRRRSR